VSGDPLAIERERQELDAAAKDPSLPASVQQLAVARAVAFSRLIDVIRKASGRDLWDEEAFGFGAHVRDTEAVAVLRSFRESGASEADLTHALDRCTVDMIARRETVEAVLASVDSLAKKKAESAPRE
jgi:hypothetical protein